jgi:hypothetical protein
MQVTVEYDVDALSSITVALKRAIDGAIIGQSTVDLEDLKGAHSILVPFKSEFTPLANDVTYRLTAVATTRDAAALEFTNTVEGIKTANVVKISGLQEKLDVGMTALPFLVQYSVNSAATSVTMGAVLTVSNTNDVVGLFSVVLYGSHGNDVSISIPIAGGLTVAEAATTTYQLYVYAYVPPSPVIVASQTVTAIPVHVSTLNTAAVSDSSSDSKSSRTTVIVGVVIGAVCAIVVVVATVMAVKTKKNRIGGQSNKKNKSEEDVIASVAESAVPLGEEDYAWDTIMKSRSPVSKNAAERGAPPKRPTTTTNAVGGVWHNDRPDDASFAGSGPTYEMAGETRTIAADDNFTVTDDAMSVDSKPVITSQLLDYDLARDGATDYDVASQQSGESKNSKRSVAQLRQAFEQTYSLPIKREGPRSKAHSTADTADVAAATAQDDDTLSEGQQQAREVMYEMAATTSPEPEDLHNTGTDNVSTVYSDDTAAESQGSKSSWTKKLRLKFFGGGDASSSAPRTDNKRVIASAKQSKPQPKGIKASALDNVRSTNDIWDWDVQGMMAPDHEESVDDVTTWTQAQFVDADDASSSKSSKSAHVTGVRAQADLERDPYARSGAAKDYLDVRAASDDNLDEEGYDNIGN